MFGRGFAFFVNCQRCNHGLVWEVKKNKAETTGRADMVSLERYPNFANLIGIKSWVAISLNWTIRKTIDFGNYSGFGQRKFFNDRFEVSLK